MQIPDRPYTAAETVAAAACAEWRVEPGQTMLMYGVNMASWWLDIARANELRTVLAVSDEEPVPAGLRRRVDLVMTGTDDSLYDRIGEPVSVGIWWDGPHTVGRLQSADLLEALGLRSKLFIVNTAVQSAHQPVITRWDAEKFGMLGYTHVPIVGQKTYHLVGWKKL